MRLSAPEAIKREAAQAAAAHRAAPSTGEHSMGDDDRAEKTMIFESGFTDLSNAPTQVGESLLDDSTLEPHAGPLSPAPMGMSRSRSAL